MKSDWRTAWQGAEILVYRDEQLVDRIHADEVSRIVCLYRDLGDTPGDLVCTLVEVPGEVVVLPAETGFAGRIHFERTEYWAERACIYWLPSTAVRFPLSRLGPVGWLRWLRWPLRPVFGRLASADLHDWMSQWPLEGPQTWEQRKWRRIQRARPFSRHDGDDAPPAVRKPA